MHTLRVTLTLAAALLLIGTPVRAQVAHEEFMQEAEILEHDMDALFAARERERAAVQEVRSLNEQLGRLLADLSAPVSEMRRLESRIATATDRAYQSLQETARARSLIYDQMEHLEELARQFEETPPAPIDQDNPQGLWEFRLAPNDVRALVDLSFQTGGLNANYVAVGSYRSSNGHHGTLRGTFGGNRMELEVMDSRAGKVADLTGTVGFEGRLEGTWRAVATGLDQERRGGGTWTGHRVASESDVSLD